MRILPIVLIFSLFLSCSKDTLQEAGDFIAQKDLNIELHWYPAPDSPRKDTVLVSIPDGPLRDSLQKLIPAEESEAFKCGYEGKLLYTANDGKKLQVEFQLREDCRHLSFMWQETLHHLSLDGITAGLLAQKRPGPSKLSDLEFMLGAWKQNEQLGYSIERWERNGDKFKGLAYSVEESSGDTIFSEKLLIEQRQDGMYYVADIPQNPQPVSFKLTEISTGKAAFENPDHDFPQRIDYYLDGDTLRAIVSGIANGQAIRHDLNMAHMDQ